jgi:hypothetical protein
MTNQELPFASDADCATRRAILISCGVIVPAAKTDYISKKDGSEVISTYRSSRAWRRKLIEQGIIDPKPEYVSTYRRDHMSGDEGHYESKPITSDDEYERKKEVYLWMVSDILRTRKRLKLVFGEKPENCPDWYF